MSDVLFASSKYVVIKRVVEDLNLVLFEFRPRGEKIGDVLVIPLPPLMPSTYFLLSILLAKRGADVFVIDDSSMLCKFNKFINDVLRAMDLLKPDVVVSHGFYVVTDVPSVVLSPVTSLSDYERTVRNVLNKYALCYIDIASCTHINFDDMIKHAGLRPSKSVVVHGDILDVNTILRSVENVMNMLSHSSHKRH